MTKAEYEALYPLGSVNTQDGDTARPMTAEEWQAWVDETWNASNPTQAEVDALRHAAYVAESDPLFFQYQAGEITEQEWLDKRAEIKSRYPNPEV
jgi:hypothetical protein